MGVDVDLDRARLQIMTAAALFEARTGDRDAAVDTGVDAVRAAQTAVAAAEAREGRPVDRQRRLRIVGGEDALIAAPEHPVDDIEIARFKPDARAIAVGNRPFLKDAPNPPRPH